MPVTRPRRKVALEIDPHHRGPPHSDGSGGSSHEQGDPLRHPDLEHVARRLRGQYDEVLEAEQYAAFAASRRLRSLRDRLLEAEDRGELTIASCSDGQLYRGVVEAVGTDHFVLIEDGRTRFVSISHVVGMEFA